MYNPVQIANKFIELGIANGAPITQMQAQKLTYIAQGISLGHRGQSVLTDPVCAWRYGPVVPSLYHTLKHFGSKRIVHTVNSYTSTVHPQALDGYVNQLITNVFDTYGKYSAETLSEFTHREGTPWRQTYDAGNTIIDNDLIQHYYQRLMARDPSCIGL
ncbi:type II toxin-antitoxin system antitoxin SocA domain-containing protein [Erwinia sp. Eh17-17]|uniref:Panacea domain-containing protein n=1 Tax=Erwinia sp. Eh17-17 TaxID=3080330 RepID=UPI00320A31A9